jgi:hypothetical protein
MRSNGNTGATAPGWIRDEARRRAEAWPPLVLGAALGLALALKASMGAWLWSAEAIACYARP